MDLNQRKELKNTAKQRLENAQEGPKIALIFSCMILLLGLITNVVSFGLGLQIEQSTGLRNLSLRSTLSAIQTFLPMVISVLIVVISLGFRGTMLRISRGQYASARGMKIGFDRFWLLLRLELLRAGCYFVALILGSQIGFGIWMITPMSRSFLEVVNTVPMDQGNAMTMMMDAAVEAQLLSSLLPMMFLTGLLTLALVAILFYRFRMADYVILDEPGIPALLALRRSAFMMKKNYKKMFLLDLSMWWYYLAMVLTMLVGYGDMFLSLMGVTLPFSSNVMFFISLALYLGLNFLVTLFLRPHVEVVYGLAYDSLRPKPRYSGVVLGNIFTM